MRLIIVYLGWLWTQCFSTWDLPQRSSTDYERASVGQQLTQPAPEGLPGTAAWPSWFQAVCQYQTVFPIPLALLRSRRHFIAPHSPPCGHGPLPLTQSWLPDSLTSSAVGQSAPSCPSLEGNGEVSCHLQKEVCNTLFVQTSPLTRETPKHMYSSQSSPWG